MSIQSEITRIKNAKNSIIFNLQSKGISVSTDAKIDTLPTVVETIEVAKPTQTKSITITENGTQTVSADSDKSLSSVEITTNVSGGGGSTKTFTGHLDRTGLLSIGWTNDEITETEKNVSWNSNNDNEFLLTQDELNGNVENAVRFLKSNVSAYTLTNAKRGNIVALNLSQIPISSLSAFNSGFSNFKSLIAIPENLNISKYTNLSNLFSYCYSLKTIPLLNFSNNLYLNSAFANCYSLETIPLIDTSKTYNFDATFQNCYNLKTIPLIDTSSAQSCSMMFQNCYSLKTIPQLNTSNSVNFGSMFSGCYCLLTIPTINTGNGTKFNSMFASCSNLINVPLLDTSKATDVSNMFQNCSSLKNIPALNTPKVTSFANAFQNTLIETIPQLDYSKATTLTYTFAQTKIVNADFSGLDLSECTNFNYSLYNNTLMQTANLSDVNNSKTSIQMQSMFGGNSTLTSVDLSGFSGTVSRCQNMFSSCSSLTSVKFGNLDFTGITSSTYYSNMLPSTVPATCYILFKDEANKNWFTAKFSRFTNVHYVGE